jgi:hypothetical protein
MEGGFLRYKTQMGIFKSRFKKRIGKPVDIFFAQGLGGNIDALSAENAILILNHPRRGCVPTQQFISFRKRQQRFI